MRYAIPVTLNTIPLISKLNDGVAPEVESEKTFFIYDADHKGANFIVEYYEISKDGLIADARIDIEAISILE